MVGVVVDGEAVVSTEEAAEIEVTPTPELVTAMVHKGGINPKVPKGATRAPNTQMGLQIPFASPIIPSGSLRHSVGSHSLAPGRILLWNENSASSTRFHQMLFH